MVSIIGFGRFGRLLAEILKPDFDVAVYSRRDIRKELAHDGYRAVGLEESMDGDAVFFAVPISSFEEVVRQAEPFIRRAQPGL